MSVLFVWVKIIVNVVDVRDNKCVINVLLSTRISLMIPLSSPRPCPRETGSTMYVSLCKGKINCDEIKFIEIN